MNSEAVSLILAPATGLPKVYRAEAVPETIWPGR